MCGIAGIAALSRRQSPTEAQVRAMTRMLHHRGPDDEGVCVDARVGLGQSRLSIIDLESGHQPLFNEDGTVAVICNGEIYNYRELRRSLAGRGHSFASNSDTEVLAHLWEDRGPDAVHELNGMFAAAIYDRRRDELMLVRDHLGIKPLYYAEMSGGLIFGSEVKALLASGLVRRELNMDALGQFLAWEHIPGEDTLLKHVHKLPPGHLLRANLRTGQVWTKEYWDVPLRGETVNGKRHFDDWARQVEAQIQRSVRQQMVSDVPLGAFLSGGVDSSLVTAAMGGQAQTFSIGFDDPTYNELPWAHETAQALGVEHISDVLRPDVDGLFDRLMRQMDDPIGDFSIFPTYLVCRHARQRVTVALSGDGGDELFGGYETYLAQDMARHWQRLPRPLRRGAEQVMRRLPPGQKKKGLVNKARRFAEGLVEPEALGHARWRIFAGQMLRPLLFTEAAQREMVQPVSGAVGAYARRAAHCAPITRALYVDTKTYLPENILVKMDRMSMASSLEARVPLLDKDLVELAFSAPPQHKLRSRETKPLLKAVARRHVPKRCVDRPKEGFSIPIKHWLCDAFRDRLEHYLDRDRLAAAGIFEADAVERLKQEHLSGRANHSHVLWSLMVFEDWRDRWGV